MHRTRAILAWGGRVGGASKRFLLPAENFWDVASAGFAGLWAHWSDPTARDEYEKLVADRVIKESVLARARQGSMLTMALFQNLRNPLFAKHRFDAMEFVDGVAPALETFHDTLGHLLQDMNESLSRPGDEKEEDRPAALVSILASENTWRTQAKEDPDSLAAQLSNMVSYRDLDDHYYGARLSQALTVETGAIVLKYVPGSCVVGQVALLSARALEIDSEQQQQQGKAEHPEFAATDNESRNPPVVARIDILYEITRSFQQFKDLKSASEQRKFVSNVAAANTVSNAHATSPPGGPAPENSGDTGTTSQAGRSASSENETTIPITEGISLSVAVFEGWLHGGPEEDLRWRIAMVRDAHEFT